MGWMTSYCESAVGTSTPSLIHLSDAFTIGGSVSSRVLAWNISAVDNSIDTPTTRTPTTSMLVRTVLRRSEVFGGRLSAELLTVSSQLGVTAPIKLDASVSFSSAETDINYSDTCRGMNWISLSRAREPS
jgi:hypothetical protein